MPAVLTVQDLSWERDPSVFGWWDRAIFKVFVRRSVKRARHVFAISERTKRDLVELYGTPQEKITVTPLAPIRTSARRDEHDSFLLFVSAIEPRKQPLDAIDAANAVGRELIVVGPPNDAELAAELTRRGADVRGYVPKEELVRLYQRRARSSFRRATRASGCPLSRRWLAARRSSRHPSPPCRRSPAMPRSSPTTSPTASAARLPTVTACRPQVSSGRRLFSWRETARITADVYRKILGA